MIDDTRGLPLSCCSGAKIQRVSAGTPGQVRARRLVTDRLAHAFLQPSGGVPAGGRAGEVARASPAAEHVGELESARLDVGRLAGLDLELLGYGREGAEGERGSATYDARNRRYAYLLDVHLSRPSPRSAAVSRLDRSREVGESRLGVALKQSGRGKFSAARSWRAEPRRRFASLIRYTTAPRLPCTRSRSLQRPAAVPLVVTPLLSPIAIASLTPPPLSSSFRHFSHNTQCESDEVWRVFGRLSLTLPDFLDDQAPERVHRRVDPSAFTITFIAYSARSCTSLFPAMFTSANVTITRSEMVGNSTTRSASASAPPVRCTSSRRWRRPCTATRPR